MTRHCKIRITFDNATGVQSVVQETGNGFVTCLRAQTLPEILLVAPSELYGAVNLIFKSRYTGGDDWVDFKKGGILVKTPIEVDAAIPLVQQNPELAGPLDLLPILADATPDPIVDPIPGTWDDVILSFVIKEDQ